MRALREAGPPIRWIVAAIPLALAAVVVLYVAGVRNQAVLLAIPLVAFVLVCLIDRDGWRIRMAMAEVASRQRERWRWGRIPIDAISADAWLAAHADAPPAARASVMATVGRHEEALDLVTSASAERPQDAVNLARLRILFAAEGRGDHSVEEALAMLAAAPEMGGVPPEERRSQRLALAWSIAWLRIRAGEQWRTEFADAVRDLGPFQVTRRYRVFHAIQQFALPIAYVLALLIVWASGPGRRPAARLICDNRAIHGGGTESKAGSGAPWRNDEVGPALDRDGPAARSARRRSLACRV